MGALHSFNYKTNNKTLCSNAWSRDKIPVEQKNVWKKEEYSQKQHSLNSVVTPTKESKSKVVDISLVTQSAVKLNKSEAKINEEKFKRFISNKLSDLFIHCSTVPASSIRILNGLDSKLSDNQNSVDKADNVNTVIELLR